jgi:hypothetical protein
MFVFYFFRLLCIVSNQPDTFLALRRFTPTTDLAGFHGDFSDSYCKIPFDYIGFTLAYFGWTSIMTLRVCALWRQQKMLVRFIKVLWVCVMASVIAIGYLGNKQIAGEIIFVKSE